MKPPPRHRLVLDTNTVLALWMFRDPQLELLRAWAEAGELSLLTRADALEELDRVLAYRQFALDEAARSALLTDYRGSTTVLPAPDQGAAPLPPCRDPDDQKFLEIARDGAAHALLSRDKALLRLRTHRLIRERYAILTPEAWQAQQETG
jgi:putative PIN family toxin of toxin-antitoxin system